MKHLRKSKFAPAFLSLMLTGMMMQNCNGQDRDKASLLILSKKDHVLAVTDPASLQIVARIPVGEDPHEVTTSPDGTRAYVSIYGGGRFHTINVIDLTSNKRLEDVDTRPLFGPHGIVYAAGKVWFSAEGSKAVGRYDPERKIVDWSMGTGQDRSHMIYVTNDGREVYCTNVNSGTVSVLDETSTDSAQHQEWEQTVIPSSKGSEGFDVSPDGRELWTASSQDGHISIINLKNKQQETKIDAKAQGANRLKFSRDGKLVFISSLSQHELIVFDAKERKEKKRIELGAGAAGIETDPNGKRIFVACTGADKVLVIDLQTLSITSQIPLAGPDGMAWAARR